MKILVTGAGGYIGKRIIPLLLNQNHQVICSVRDKNRFKIQESIKKEIEVIEIDFLNINILKNLPTNIDIAFFLMHSMSSNSNYSDLEFQMAQNFKTSLENTSVKQVIYLSGIVNEKNLSKHLLSRLNVENILKSKKYNLSVFRAGIIIGSGSASFEIIRDLVEKLPIMITPKWLNTRCQPISISDVLKILVKSIGNKNTYNKAFDIGGKDILTYKQMLLQFGHIRGLKRKIFTIPIMSPRLSSYWLYFMTSTSYKLAVALVDSMKIEVVCKDNSINKILDIKPLGYKESVKRAFKKIDQNEIVSSWKDSLVSGNMHLNTKDFVQVPSFGCLKNYQEIKFKNIEITQNNIYNIGGENGWYYGNFLWKIRGNIDKLFGGVGLRRGRTNKTKLSIGDAVDFWRVLYTEKSRKRLVLYAEMKLPGEAWLEFKIENKTLYQTATFRPKGLIGRLYWYSLAPFHYFIFKGLIRKLIILH